MTRLWLCFPLLLLAASSQAQIPATPPAGTNVEVDPIRCWWKTDAGAIRVGQIFNVTLTCAALENDAVKVMVDESRLGATAIQLAPFEVLGGSHPADLQSGARRFFQYHYQLRIISPDAIGKDTALPAVSIHYAINNQLTGNASVQGRDLVYLLPPQAIRIASLVPTDATDIRDAGGEDFGNVETFLFRASVLEIVATTCVALGVLMVALVLVSIARRARTRTPVGERQLPTRRLVQTAAHELGAVAREREAGGWNEGLVARALAATRVTAAAAIGANVSQRLAGGTAAGDGRLVASGGFRGKARVISGSTTPYDLQRAITSATGADAARGPLLESLRDALTAFGLSQYGRDVAIDQGRLDSALSAAQSASSQVRGEHSWLKTALQQWRSGGETPAASRA